MISVSPLVGYTNQKLWVEEPRSYGAKQHLERAEEVEDS